LEWAHLKFKKGDRNYGEPINRLRKLIEFLKEGKDRSPLAEARYQLGFCHFEMKKPNYQDAAKAFEDMLAMEDAPKGLRLSATYQAGESWFRWGEAPRKVPSKEDIKAAKPFDNARKHFENVKDWVKVADDTDRDLPKKASLRIGHCYNRQEKWPEAEQAFSFYLKNHSEHEPLFIRKGHFGRGKARFMQYQAQERIVDAKKYDEAIGDLREAAGSVDDGKIDRMGAEAQFLIGECYRASNRLSEAVREYNLVQQDYSSIEEWDIQAMYYAGLTLGKMKKIEGAIKKLEDLLEKYKNTKNLSSVRLCGKAESEIEGLESSLNKPK
jgi:tetratricopeptide (TPR) repeat protein